MALRLDRETTNAQKGGMCTTTTTKKCTIFGTALMAMVPMAVHLQEIPLHSSGGVVQHKSAYYGQIYVGGPLSQHFEVVFDTGSGHLGTHLFP